MKKHIEIEGKYFLKNGKALEVSQLQLEELYVQPSVYEVIRVSSGVPLFLEEHLNRLRKSIELLGFKYSFSFEDLRNKIHDIIKINDNPQLNIKLIVNHLEAIAPMLFMFFIPSQYPSAEAYRDGVTACTYRAERHNPNAKVVANKLREEINRAIELKNTYEAILINSNNEITEGSRSNVFLVKDNAVYTAPAKDVLVGITRSRIIDICNSLGIKVIEATIPFEFLKGADGLFITGTSPKVLPVSSVDSISFASADSVIIKRISVAYNDMIDRYISSYNIEGK